MSLWYKFKSGFISWFADIRIYPGGIILFGDSHYHLKGDSLREILNLVRPGDIILRRYSHYIGSVLVKGYWSHASVYVGNNRVIHMLGDGITNDDILVFLRCDDACILRHEDKSKAEEAVEKAWKMLEAKIEYDYDFDSKLPDKFYCTEFVDYCFDYIVRDNLAKTYIYPDDFLDPAELKVIWRKSSNDKS